MKQTEHSVNFTNVGTEKDVAKYILLLVIFASCKVLESNLVLVCHCVCVDCEDCGPTDKIQATIDRKLHHKSRL